MSGYHASVAPAIRGLPISKGMNTRHMKSFYNKAIPESKN